MNHVLILITDDDEDDRLFLRRAIERHIKKAVVQEAHNGEEALKWLNQEDRKFNLVVLDVNMPGVNGIEVLSEMRSNTHYKHTPTVILSTSDHPRQIQEAYNMGVNSYIKKPDSYQKYDEIIMAIKTCFLDAS